VENLPDVESPEWAGLPSNAEKLIKAKQALSTISKFLSIQGTGDDEVAYTDSSQEESRSAWLVSLGKRIVALLDLLPATLASLHRTQASMNNPLFRFLEREIMVG